MSTEITSEQWAAWVQAIGSVVAIFAAAGIAAWQSFVERRLAAEEEERRRESTRRMCLLFGAKLLETLEKHVLACDREDQELLVLHGHVVDEITEWPPRIDISVLSGEAVAEFLGLLSIGAEAKGRVCKLREDAVFAGFAHWGKIFQRLRERVEEHLEKLRTVVLD